ncbi:MAG: glycosyltransferase [Patescibacteria group bacterium]|jgi:glycosyltransferase involved in cell wall biosynthesis
MKILYIITKAVVGGAQMSVLNLAREMKKRGHEVSVGFGEGDFLPAELAKENIPFIKFKNLRRTHNPFYPLFFIFEIKKYLSNKNLDVIHFNSSNALPGALGVKLFNNKIKTVFTFRGMSMLDEHYEAGKLKKLFYFLFFKFFLLFVDVPVFVSQENFDKFGQGALVDNGVMIHNGLDPNNLDFLSRDEVRNFFSQKIKEDLSDKYVIGSIGRLHYQKNYEFLINIFPEILRIRPDARAVIVGEGPERRLYEDLIRKNNLEEKIFLFGSLDNGGRYLKGFDVLALPSRYEGLSITLIEALFAGSPVLASDVGGNREEISFPEAEIYSLDNKKEFLEKFSLLQVVEILEKIKNGNKILAEEFNLKKTADSYEKNYGK